MATDHPQIGDRIRRARNLKRPRLTQARLAALVGVDRKTVDNWENDRTYPGQRIPLLEQVLGVSLAEDDDEPDPGPRDADQLEQLLRHLRETASEIERRIREQRQGGDFNAEVRRFGT